MLGASLSFSDVSAAKRLYQDLESANQELEAAYEELQSTNEELGTTNEELTAMNEALRERGDELGRVNGFLESILTSLRGGVIVVNPELRVLVWNARAHELWGLSEEEVVGKHVLALDIGLPVERLKQPMKSVLADGSHCAAEVELEATNRRGRPIRCRVGVTQLRSSHDGVRGLILVMEDVAADR